MRETFRLQGILFVTMEVKLEFAHMLQIIWILDSLGYFALLVNIHSIDKNWKCFSDI